MGRLKWQQIRNALREQDRLPPVPAPAAFWTVFRQRLGAGPAAAVRPAVHPFGLPWPRLVWAFAALAFIATALTTVVKMSTHERRRDGAIVAAVEEIEVFVPYSSMMIMQDEQSGGAIVWVAGLDVREDSG